jgi:hypothetical protein
LASSRPTVAFDKALIKRSRVFAIGHEGFWPTSPNDQSFARLSRGMTALGQPAPPASRRARQPVELRLLLIAERIDTVQPALAKFYNGLQQGAEPLLHGGQAAGRGERLIGRTVLSQDVGRLSRCVLAYRNPDLAAVLGEECLVRRPSE